MGSEWKSIRLGDVIEVNPQRILNAEKTHPYIPMDAIPSWSRKVSRIERRSERSGSKFKNGDVLLARITPCLENGKTAYVDMLKDDEVGVGSTEFIVLHGKEGITDNLFVYYLSRTESFRSHAIKSMSGTSGRQRVPNSAIENYEFFLPPLDEQKRIAHILGTLDDKIELNQRMNETLEAMARALFKAWFVDFEPVKAKMNGEPYSLPDEIMDLFPDELVESELGLIPMGWKIEKLGDYLSFQYGKALKESKRVHGSVPVFGSNGIIGWHNDSLVKGPGIIIGRKGNPGLITWSQTNFYPIDTTFFLLIKKDPKSLIYYYFLLGNSNLPNLSADSAVPGLNRNIAYSIKINIPSSSLIKKFDDIVTLIFLKIHENSNEIVSVKGQIKFLMGEYFNYQIQK